MWAAPARAHSSAVARPIPLLPPVIAIDLPASLCFEAQALILVDYGEQQHFEIRMS